MGILCQHLAVYGNVLQI